MSSKICFVLNWLKLYKMYFLNPDNPPKLEHLLGHQCHHRRIEYHVRCWRHQQHHQTTSWSIQLLQRLPTLGRLLRQLLHQRQPRYCHVQVLIIFFDSGNTVHRGRGLYTPLPRHKKVLNLKKNSFCHFGAFAYFEHTSSFFSIIIGT